MRSFFSYDPKGQTAHIYRTNGEIQIVPNFDQTLSGEDVLVGFKLDLNALKGWGLGCDFDISPNP